MTVRRAAGSDAAALERLIAAMNSDQGDPITPTDLRRDLIDKDRAIVLVAEAPGHGLIGYVTAHHTYETGHAEHGLYVGDLYVVPAHRRQGVARALLAALARQGHARGARHLWLTAKPGNIAAHAFYRRLGSRGEPVVAFAVVEQDFLNLAAEQPR
ncbi:GNAT family N-acetyltransferase [Roseomonas sp. CAU 1739]|uniref:GNAT family N-acetyltransferase n=1 Tax=Roseomonas sp. CAU 1739 TaxID=3140364 RepID=UPI00325AE9B7